jgi:hypothetical protein
VKAVEEEKEEGISKKTQMRAGPNTGSARTFANLVFGAVQRKALD